MSLTRETVHSAMLGLTYDEEDVLRDLIGAEDAPDGTIERYGNALNSLRIKTGLHYSATRGVDVTEAVAATEYLADKARNERLDLRLSWDWDGMTYTLTVGEHSWVWDTLYTLLPRAARELGWRGVASNGSGQGEAS